MTKSVNLYGRVLISGYIQAKTGLHIGKGKEGVSIGGVDNPVMRDILSNEPYIPGSSLKGKLRSLAEKQQPGLIMDFPPRAKVQLHVCPSKPAYLKCNVCRIYGVPGQQDSSAPTRLIVRDVRLEQLSRMRLRAANTDLPYTEVKYEASIDRVTSEANPRPLERVPAETVFGPFEMIFSIYEDDDLKLIRKLFEAMRLLEDDYLGGSGSRGSGKIRFERLTVTAKPVGKYAETNPTFKSETARDLDDLFGKLATIDKMISDEIQTSATETPEAHPAADAHAPTPLSSDLPEGSAEEPPQPEESTHG